MPSLEEFFLNNTLVNLQISTGWTIVKNNLFNLNLNYIARLQDEDNEFFIIEDIYLLHDVFYASYYLLDSHDVSVYVTSYPQKDKNGRYISFEYEIDLIVSERTKKKKNIVNYTTRVIGFENVQSALNKILLFVYIKLDKLIENKELDTCYKIL